MSLTWQQYMTQGINAMLSSELVNGTLSEEHIEQTPARVVKAYQELFAGCNQKPEDALNTLFDSKSSQMIAVKEITFFSTCGHHLLTFHGTCSFAYIPDKKIVGLSKIPRLVEVFARRPQVQEDLTEQIVGSFQDIVKPLGCGLVMRAWHLCCMSRGIKQPTSYTETTALRGNFNEPSTKAEFLNSVNSGYRLL